MNSSSMSQTYELYFDENRQLFWDELLGFWMRKKIKVDWPPIHGYQLDLYQLYHLVQERGGLESVVRSHKWPEILEIIKYPEDDVCTMQSQYEKYLYAFECDGLKVSTGDETTEETENSSQETQGSEFLVAEWCRVQGTTASSSQAVEIDVNHMEQQNVSLVMPSGSAKRKHNSNEQSHNAASEPMEPPLKRATLIAGTSSDASVPAANAESSVDPPNQSSSVSIIPSFGLTTFCKGLSENGDRQLCLTINCNGETYSGFLLGSH